MVIFLSLFTGGLNELTAQDVVNRNECGENGFIQTFIRGVLGGNVRDEITIPQIDGFLVGYAEIWVTSSECNTFPNTIELTSSSGEVRNATPTDIADPGGTETERVYRATFNNPLTSYEVTNSRTCDDIVSMTLSVESFRENSASFLLQFDRELDGPRVNSDDCISFSLNVGAEDVARDFVVSLPIHEKDATSSNRTVSYTITSGNNTVSQTRHQQNAGPEAAQYNATIRVPANQNTLRIELCSPASDGDSFGIGAVVVSTTECPSCEPQPDIDIAAVTDQLICQGGSVQISASTSGGFGRCEIQWQRRILGQSWQDFANGQNTVTLGTGFLSSPGIYDVRAIYSCDGLLCAPSTSNQVRIEVFADPSVNLDADDTEICVGETVGFSVTTDDGVGSCELINESRVGTSGPWQVLGSRRNFTQRSIFETPGTYQFRSRYDCDGASCSEDISNVVTIEVTPGPSISIAADNSEVCLGEVVVVTANVSGGIGSCAIQWQRRPQGGTWENRNNGVLGTSFLSAPGIYQVRAFYDCDGPSCGEASSNVVNVEVFPQPEITLQADDTAVCLGEVVDITPTLSGGTGDCTIQWQRRVGTSGPWLNTNNGNAGLGFLTAPGEFQYRALYNCDGASCAQDISNVVTIEVSADRSVSIEADDLAVCLGEAVDLTATVNGGTGNCDFQYQIRRPGQASFSDIANGTTKQVIGPGVLSTPGVYEFRGLYDCNGANCAQDISNVVTIEVFADPSISICLLYTSPSPRDRTRSRMPSSA